MPSVIAVNECVLLGIGLLFCFSSVDSEAAENNGQLQMSIRCEHEN